MMGQGMSSKAEQVQLAAAWGCFFFLVWARLTTGDQRRRGPCRLQLYLDTYRVVGDAQKSLLTRSEEVPPFSVDTRAASGDFCEGRPGG